MSDAKPFGREEIECMRRFLVDHRPSADPSDLDATARWLATVDALEAERDEARASAAMLREALEKFKWAAAPEHHQGTSAYPYEEIQDALASTPESVQRFVAEIERKALERAGELQSAYDPFGFNAARLLISDAEAAVGRYRSLDEAIRELAPVPAQSGEEGK